MIRLKALVLVLLLSMSFSQMVNADSGYGDPASEDDTCTEGTGILNRIVADITTLGLFSAYSENFYMDGANGRGNAEGCNSDYYPNPP